MNYLDGEFGGFMTDYAFFLVLLIFLLVLVSEMTQSLQTCISPLNFLQALQMVSRSQF